MKLKGQEMGLQLANLASQIKLNESQANKNTNGTHVYYIIKYKINAFLKKRHEKWE